MAEIDIRAQAGVLVVLPVAANIEIETGNIVCVNAAGNAVEGALVAGEHCIGRCYETADNTGGAAGDINVRVERGPSWIVNSLAAPLLAADVGNSCYVEDSETVRDFVPAGVNVRAGKVLQVSAADGVLVDFDSALAPVGTAIVGNVTILGDVAVTGDVGIDGELEIATGHSITGVAELTLESTGAEDILIHSGRSIFDELGDAAGADDFSVRDNASAVVFNVDSDGNTALIGTLQAGGLLTADGGVAIPTTMTLAGEAELTLLSTGAEDILIHSGRSAFVELGDDAGVDDFSVRNSASAVVANVDSLGNAALDGTLDVAGLITAAAGLTVPAAQMLTVAPTAALIVSTADVATGGAPTQLEMAAAFGAGADGQIGIIADTTPGDLYLCGFNTALGGWWQLAFTAVGA